MWDMRLGGKLFGEEGDTRNQQGLTHATLCIHVYDSHYSNMLAACSSLLGSSLHGRTDANECSAAALLHTQVSHWLDNTITSHDSFSRMFCVVTLAH